MDENIPDYHTRMAREDARYRQLRRNTLGMARWVLALWIVFVSCLPLIRYIGEQILPFAR